MSSRMDGHHDPAAAGAPFVWCVENRKECITAGLGRAVDGSYHHSECFYFSQRIYIPLESMQLYPILLIKLAFVI